MCGRASSMILGGLILFATSGAQAQGLPGSQDAYIPAQIDEDAERAVHGINAFSLDLYKHRIRPGENLFLSPASVSVAVGLVYRGAKAQTAEELSRTLHFNAAPTDYLLADGQLLSAMNFSGPGRQLAAANSVWLKHGMPLKPDFETDITRYAKAGLHDTNFSDPETARLIINSWVAQNTHDKITELLRRGDVSPDTGAVLVNALYWKGDWVQPFAESATRPEVFNSAEGQKITTSLMHAEADFAVLERNGVKAISMPYRGGEVSMIVLLPNSPNALDHLEQKLNSPELERWIHDLQAAPHRQTILTLPKIHLDWHDDLKEDLVSMGAPTAFSEDADFSGIAVLPYPGGNPAAKGLKIAHVIHEATIDIAEKNTEAAAATAVVMDIVITSARRGPPPPPPFIFRADHPFLFALVDNRTDMILFMGRYVVPKSAVE